MDLGVLKSFYSGKRVIITGHTGFKGQWLTLILARMGAHVLGISSSRTKYTDIFLDGSKLNEVDLDITKYKELNDCLKIQQPDVIFHLAAVATLEEAAVNPLRAVEVNALGTANVLEAARHTKNVRALICVTTDKVYADNFGKALTEDDALGGKELYSASKAAADIFTNAYYSSFFSSEGVGVASVRAGNVIGGGDANTSRLVPRVISALKEDRPVMIGNPEHARPWQYVLEPLYGYLQLAYRLTQEPSEYSEAWNFGPDENNAKKVHEITEEMMRLWGRSDKWLPRNDRRYIETKRLVLNSAKARGRLSWNNLVDPHEAVRLTMEWYKGFFAGEDMTRFSNDQIEAYESRLQIVRLI